MELIRDGERTTDTTQPDCWVVRVCLTRRQDIRLEELDERSLCRKDGNERLRAD